MAKQSKGDERLELLGLGDCNKPIIKTTPYKEATMALNMDTLKELRARTNLSMGACKKALLETDNNIDQAIDLLKKWGELKSKEKASAIASEGMVLSGVDNFNVGAIVEVNCMTDFCSKSPEFQTFAQTFLEHILFVNGFVQEEQLKITKLREALVQKTGENIVCRRNKLFAYEGDDHICQINYNHPGNKLASLVVFEATDIATKTDPSSRALMEDIAMQVAASDPIAVSEDNVTEAAILRQKEIFEGQLREEKKPADRWSKIIEGKFDKWYKDTVLLKQLFIKDTSKSISKLLEEAGNKFKIVEFARYGLGEGIEKAAKEDLSEEVKKLIHPFNV